MTTPTLEDSLAAVFINLRPQKEQFVQDAAQKIASVYDELETKDVETILWELHESQISDLSKVLSSPLALVAAEYPIDNTVDIYCQAEKVNKRITYGIYLRHTPEDESEEIELARIIRWSETIKDFD
jgi:hypothetical protein